MNQVFVKSVESFSEYEKTELSKVTGSFSPSTYTDHALSKMLKVCSGLIIII